MAIDTKVSMDAVKVAQEAIKQHGTDRAELIPILSYVNREVGYLPAAALEEISSKLHVPQSQILSVASFYQMLSTQVRGRHVIKFCESAPCHVVGGRQVWQALQNELQLKPGETTEDGMWTLVTTSCLGVCAVGPVIIVDDDIYGNVQPDQVHQILARYQ
ncbi:MAG TPA: NADH-quinone oxidoreductase subunit NuoE [Longilinea sp.]|nr:NADH-quinone oxidoreductase subunit NuoE [Longilinea sp.]